ncbi:MAG: PorP/SprF family type IX secretion system membrane protein [Bacteroidota bacterium]
MTKNRLVVALTLILLGSFLTDLRAQDKHFSQFFSSPLTLNPALTGAFDGKLRLAGIYRDQWQPALQESYTTFASSIDLRFDAWGYGSNYKDAFAVGVVFYTDRAPGVDFSTNQMSISTAFHKALDLKSTQYLSLGISAGIAQRNINYSNLEFSDQFDGSTGYGGLSAEDLPENNYSFVDFAAGVNYSYAPKYRTSIYAGAAIYHFLQPSVTFYDLDNNQFEDSRLFLKYSTYLAFSFPLADRVALHPRVNAHLQGPHFTLNVGTNVRFLLSQYSGTAIHIGSWVRPVREQANPLEFDILVGMFGLEYKNVLLGFSYDIGLSQLSSSLPNRTAFEISLAYLGNYNNETVLCPTF